MQGALCRNASEVRKNWSTTIDSVVHERPVFVNRTHDSIALIDERLLAILLQDYCFHLDVEQEDDGSITGYLEELGLVENAATKDGCIEQMIAAMRDYALDYYGEFSYWSKAPNRVAHIPYVLKILISSNEAIAEGILCQDGRN